MCCNNIAWNWDYLKGWTHEESNCCRITKHIEPFCTHTSTDSTSSQITMYMQLLNSFHVNYKLIYKRTWSLYLLTRCFITCRWIFLGTKIFSFLLFCYVNERIDNKTKSLLSKVINIPLYIKERSLYLDIMQFTKLECGSYHIKYIKVGEYMYIIQILTDTLLTLINPI